MASVASTYVLAILPSNEEYHLSRSSTCFEVKVYMRYDFVRLDNLPYTV